jgi:hypothetical protein
MTLNHDDAVLFFKLMFSLQRFVNNHLQLFQVCLTNEEYKDLETNDKLAVREALYKDNGLIDLYVDKNPDELNNAELDIVRGWKLRIYGDFFLERYLRRYAIFMGEKAVYAVYGLFDPFDHMYHPGNLPLRVRTALLPFKGKIVFDGVMGSYNIHFGSGVRGRLREQYLSAKQNDQILESLDPEKNHSQKKSRSKVEKDWRNEIDALRNQAQKLSTGASTPIIQAAIFKLVRASLEMAHESVHRPDQLNELWKHLKKVNLAQKQIQAVLHRADHDSQDEL